MNQNTSTFVRLDYGILAISGINSTDKIVLAYNRGDWGKNGYFASNAHAAKELCMNIKTFEKSALKLKKMGLWMVRGQIVEHAVLPTRAGDAPTPVGSTPSPVGSMPTQVGTITTRVDQKEPVLPMKTDALLDSLLDNRLDKDKKELLDNAGCAATYISTSSLSLNFSDSEGILENTIINRDTALVSKTYRNEARCAEASMEAQESIAKMMSDVEMVSANLKAWQAGRPEPYTKEDISKAKSRIHPARPPSAEDMDAFWNSGSTPATRSSIAEEFEREVGAS